MTDDNKIGVGLRNRDCYNVIHAGKTRRYRITRPNAKHFRYEWIDGNAQLIGYCGPGLQYPGSRDIIEFTDADAAKYNFMGLVIVGSGAAVVETGEPDDKSSADQGKEDDADESGAGTETNSIVIPNNWRDQNKKTILNWASQIMGSRVTDLASAKEVVEAYVDGDSNT